MAEQRGSRKLTRADVLVAAVTCLLLILLVPVLFAKPREQAMRQVCTANLRQYGIAQGLYLDENDDRFPNPWVSLVKTESPVWGYQRYCRWHDPRYPMDGPFWTYLPEAKVHLCPTFNVLAKTYGNRHPLHDPSIPIIAYRSYSMNAFLGRSYGAVAGVLKRSEITRSRAEVFFFAEENMWMRPGCGNVLNDTALCADGRDWFGTFHGVKADPLELNTGTVNAVFVDAHVDKVRSGLRIVYGVSDRSGAESHKGLMCEKFAWPYAPTTGNR